MLHTTQDDLNGRAHRYRCAVFNRNRCDCRLKTTPFFYILTRFAGAEYSAHRHSRDGSNIHVINTKMQSRYVAARLAGSRNGGLQEQICLMLGINNVVFRKVRCIKI